ncbi:MAG TPA: histidinol dehydrogenase [Candidatus Limnocylindrales bacterium]|nr:histidinol dehydrogenase [Candidatus Limnocylindrales bacterium]
MTELLRHVRLADLAPAERQAIVQRSATVPESVRAGARAIVAEVRRGGDAAVRAANERLGGGLPPGQDGLPAALRIAPARLAEAAAALPADLRAGLERMAVNIERFHAAQLPDPRQRWVDIEPGIRVGRAWRPLERVAAYVPGGTAAYPSSLLMTAIPARLAGVGSFVVATPAGAEGQLSPALLGAAGLLGIEELYVMGGAQAIAALACGTESIPAVDKIVGPGNAWVTAAKLEVLGLTGIDLPAGPSEVMVLADETADPRHVAADLLSQAEHGPDSAAVLVTTAPALVPAVVAEVERQLPSLPRHDLLRVSLGAAGLVVEAADIADALAFVDAYAPEHLSIVVADPAAAFARLRHAGSVFLGPYAPESAGDYATGSNHVLPTGRLARAYGALSVEDFGTWIQVQEVTREGLAAIRPTVAVVAEAEGLSAHRRAVDVRFEEA